MIKVQMKDIETPTNDTPVLTYCRKLLKKGTDPNEVLEVCRGDVLAIRVNGIGKGAMLNIDQETTKFARYRNPLKRMKSYGISLQD